MAVDSRPRLCKNARSFGARQVFRLEATSDLIVARDGEDFRHMADTDTDAVDVIVLDIGLPGEDGISIARRMRSESSVPLIFLSGYRLYPPS